MAAQAPQNQPQQQVVEQNSQIQSQSYKGQEIIDSNKTQKNKSRKKMLIVISAALAILLLVLVSVYIASVTPALEAASECLKAESSSLQKDNWFKPELAEDELITSYCTESERSLNALIGCFERAENDLPLGMFLTKYKRQRILQEALNIHNQACPPLELSSGRRSTDFWSNNAI